jgi:hypothetical protein
VSLRLIELAVARKIEVLTNEVEPNCWRYFTNVGGTTSTLRPDLFAVSVAGASDFEDHWFIELDLATESPVTVVRKCEQYIAYMNSGEEQKRSGVFPIILWIVPDERRKESLTSHIADNLTKDKRMFHVITLDLLEHLFTEGI